MDEPVDDVASSENGARTSAEPGADPRAEASAEPGGGEPSRTRPDAQPIQFALDEAIICHVGYLDEGGPVVVPAAHARLGEVLYLLTTSGSRLPQLAFAGRPVPMCVTVTLLDGLVLARSQVGHSINHRSVIVRGEGRLVTDEEEKRVGLAAVVEHIAAGRARHSRPPSGSELSAVQLLRVPLTDVALQSRTGPPVDDEDDLALRHWAGVIGIRNGYGPAFPAPDLPYDRPVPAQLANYSRSARPQAYR